MPGIQKGDDVRWKNGIQQDGAAAWGGSIASVGTELDFIGAETIESHVKDQLQMDLAKGDSALTVRFLGKSLLRNPGEFMTPLLLRALADAAVEKKRLVMDFRGLSYMNSSTLTPVIKILERARQSGGKISVQYRKSVKWQEISFSALIIFETQDQRITIEGWG